MSIKWYQEHVQSIIRQNQQLKFTIKKLIQKDTVPSAQITMFFKNLFVDIPSMSSQDLQNKSFVDILEYYGKVISVWMKKEKAKMDFLLENNDPFQKQTLIHPKKFSKQPKERTVRCILCDSERPSFKLQNRINELQLRLKELEQQLKSLQANQHKYLGEIAHLRSITKKLQFQLSQKLLTQTKLKSLYLLKSKKNEQQILKLKREVCIWRDQYQRMWKQQKHITQTVMTNKDDSYSSYLNNQSKIQSSSTNSNIWIIRNGQFQQEYIEQDNSSNTNKSKYH